MEGKWRSVLENLPVGWRFHPYDEEVLDCYLKRKLLGQEATDSDGFDMIVVELNEYDPRDLIAKFKRRSCDKEMYFFSRCEYHKNGLQRKRKAGGGFWKCTGDPRPVTLDDTDNVIGTKRSLVFYDHDATHFIITEYSYTAPLEPKSKSESESIKDKFVICKLKIKPNRKKIIIKKSKQAEADCKNTAPNKKARKAQLSDSNRASTTSNQNIKETFAHPACGKYESTNHTASHVDNEHTNKANGTPTYENGEESHDHCEVTATASLQGKVIATFVDQPPCEITTVSTCNQDETRCHTEPSFKKQNPVEMTDKSSYDNGKPKCHVTSDLGKCLAASVDNQNECQKPDVSFHEDCRSPLKACNVGENTSPKVESQCRKDISVLEDCCSPLMDHFLDNVEFPQISLQTLEGILANKSNDYLSSILNSFVPSTCVDNHFIPYEMDTLSTNNKYEESYIMDFGCQNPTSIEGKPDPSTEVPSVFDKTDAPKMPGMSFLEDFRSPSMATNVEVTHAQGLENQYTKDIPDHDFCHETRSHTEPSFKNQNPVEMTDKSSYDNGKPKCHVTSDLGKCLAASVDNQNECQKTDVSFHEDCRSPLKACNVGDTMSPVMGVDSDDVIGTERSLVLHNPAATQFIITEYSSTAQHSSLIMEDFVLCKLKKKSNKNTKNSKKAGRYRKLETRPNKKARKAEPPDGNTDSGSTLTSGNQNLKEMAANSTYSQSEESNRLASYLENQHLNQTTSAATNPEFTQNLCKRIDISPSYKDESTYSIAMQMTITLPCINSNKEDIVSQEFGSQDPANRTDISASYETPFDFDNQNQNDEADIFQDVQTGNTDTPVLEDNQVSMISSSEVGDTTFPEIDVQKWLEELLEV